MTYDFDNFSFFFPSHQYHHPGYEDEDEDEEAEVQLIFDRDRMSRKDSTELRRRLQDGLDRVNGIMSQEPFAQVRRRR